MKRRMTILKLLNPSILGALILLGLGLGSAKATNYEDSVSFAVSDFRCGYFVTTQLCGGFQSFDGLRTANAGDQFKVHVTLDSTFVVPGSTTSSLFYVGLPDTTATGGPGAPGPNTSSSTLIMTGYSGPSAPLTGPYDLFRDHDYLALGGFCCGYGQPTPGFSLTGAEATFNLLTSNPNPITGVSVGFSRELAVTPENLADLQGGDLSAPLALPPGMVGRISGNIGGSYPSASFYNFNWEGGLFQTRATLTGADPADSFRFLLFRDDDRTTPLADLLLYASNGFTDLINLNLGSPGNYIIGIKADGPIDPHFTLDFYTPIGSAVPEPATWAMMLLGFFGLGAVIRKQAPRLRADFSFASARSHPGWANRNGDH